MAAPQSKHRKGQAASASLGLNLGPQSTAWLRACGITDRQELQQLGSVEAYRRVRAQVPSASLNLLWALEGALQDRPWQQIKRDEGTRLLLALEQA